MAGLEEMGSCKGQRHSLRQNSDPGPQAKSQQTRRQRAMRKLASRSCYHLPCASETVCEDEAANSEGTGIDTIPWEGKTGVGGTDEVV